MDNETHLKQLGILKRLGYFSLIFWPAFLLAGFMAFDAPNSAKHIGPYIALCFSIGYGALPFIAPRLSHRALAAGHLKSAYCIAAIPFGIILTIFLAKLLRFF